MRTKALVLAAAVGALGVASSQAVNSVNVVGYINKTCVPGLTLIANQLKVGGNTLAEIIPAPPMATICYFWDQSIGDFVLLDYFGTWLYDDGRPGDGNLFPVPPGTPFFVLNQSDPPADFTLTFVGDVPQTPDPFFAKTLFGGVYTMTASAAPVSKPINDPVFTFPSTFGFNLLKFNTTIQDYLTYSFFDQWYDPDGNPGVPSVDVGEGFLILDQSDPPTDKAWNMTFTVN